MGAGVERQLAVVHRREHRHHGGCRQLDVEQLEAEDTDVELDEPPRADIAPDVAVDVGREGEVEQVQRPARDTRDQARVGHHRQHLRRADLAVALVVDADELAVLVPRDRADLDVVEVRLGGQLQAGAEADFHHTRHTQARLQADLDGQAQFGLFLAAGVRHDRAVAERRHRPIIDVETVEHGQRVIRLHRLLDAVGVHTEGQVGKGADPAECVDRDADGHRHLVGRDVGDRREGDQDIEAHADVQGRQLVGEERGVATAEDLGPVRDVGQVRQELEARPGRRAGGLAARGRIAHFGELGVEGVHHRRGARPGHLQGLPLGEGDVARRQAVDAADRQAGAEGQQALQHGRHVQRKLDRVEEGPVDRRLVGHHQFPDQVDHPAQRRVVRQHQVEADDRRRQRGDHLAEGLHDLRHLLGNRHQEIQHRRMQIEADVLDRDVGQRDGRLAQTPVPVQHEVRLQAGQAGCAQLHAEVHVAVDTEVDLERGQRVGQHAVERQAATAVALQVQPQVAGQAAGDEVVQRAGALVGDLGIEEQQRATGRKRVGDGRRLGVAVQVGPQVQRQLGLVVVGVCRQEEAAGSRQAEAEVVGPVGHQREAAVHVEAEARQVQVERDVHTQTDDLPAQLHVEADGVDIALGQGLARLPVRHQLAGLVVELDDDVVDGDAVLAVGVEQDAQIAEGLVHHLAHQLDRLARARQGGAQVLQQAAAQVADELAGVGQPGADERQVGGQGGLENVLHRAQAEVDAVEHEARVVQHVQQGQVVRHGAAEVGQLDLQRGVTRGQPGQLGQEGRQALVTQRRIGVDQQMAQRQLLRQRHQVDRQVDVECTPCTDLGLSIHQRNAQHRRVWRHGFAVSIHHDAAAEHAELDLAQAELGRHVLGHQAGRQVDAGAGLGRLVKVDDLHRGGACRRTRQGHPDTGHQPGADRIAAGSLARRVEQAAELGRQVDARQPRQLRQVEVDIEATSRLQVEGDVEVEPVVGGVERQVEQGGVDAQGILDHLLGFVERSRRRVAGLLDAGQQLIAELQDVRQRAVEQRQLLGVERLVADQAVDHIGQLAQAADDVAEAHLAEVGQRPQVGQHGHHVVGRQTQRLALGRIGDVEVVRRHQLEARPVGQVLHVQAQLQAAANVEASTATLDLQATQPCVGVTAKVKLQVRQALAQHLGQVKAFATGHTGGAVHHHVELGAQVQLRARAHATCRQGDKAELGLDREVLDIGRDGRAGGKVVDRHAEAAAAQ